MTMTDIPSQKTCYIYGQGPLKISKFSPKEENDDDDNQDSVKKYLLHMVLII